MKINEWFELYDLSLGLGSDQKLTRDAADIIRNLLAENERLKKDNLAHCTALMTTAMWEGKEEECEQLRVENTELRARVKHLDGLIGDRDAEISHATDLGIKVGRHDTFLEAADILRGWTTHFDDQDKMLQEIGYALRQRAEDGKGK